MRCLRRENYNGGGKINNRNSNIDMIRIVAMLLVVAYIAWITAVL